MWVFTKSHLVPLPPECMRLIFLNALFQGGRLFVGAICVLYFLSFGLKIEDYAWIKTAQAVAFIGFDIPLGYFLNKLGEYKSILLSLLLGIIGACGYLLSSSFFGFLISETFLALSLSMWPVAFSAYSMRIIENYKTEGLVEKFFHFGDGVTNFFVLLCGSLGGFLYAFNKYIPYGCFLLFYLFAVIFVFLILKNLEKAKRDKKEKAIFFSSIFEEFKIIVPFASILFLTQFFMQPLFHYWQPLFEENFGMNSEEMSIVFIGYSLTMSGTSWAYSRMTHVSFLRSDLFVLSAGLLGGITFGLITQFNVFISYLLLFSLSFGIFNLIQIAAGVLVQNRIKKDNRMIITKYVSFYSRIGMIFSLFILHFLFANRWTTNEIFKLYGFFALLTFALYLTLLLFKRQKENRYVYSNN